MKNVFSKKTEHRNTKRLQIISNKSTRTLFKHYCCPTITVALKRNRHRQISHRYNAITYIWAFLLSSFFFFFCGYNNMRTVKYAAPNTAAHIHRPRHKIGFLAFVCCVFASSSFSFSCFVAFVVTFQYCLGFSRSSYYIWNWTTTTKRCM